MDDILAPRFIDPVAARKHLEALRWPDDEPVCVHCGSTDTTRLEGKKHRDGLLQCNDCREQFTVTVGTIFERSKIALNKWLLCNHLLCAGKALAFLQTPHHRGLECALRKHERCSRQHTTGEFQTRFQQ